MSTTELIQLVQNYLDDVHPGGSSLSVVRDGVRHEENWWYVPVLPDVQPEKRFEYYEALAEVETRLQFDNDLTVLFLPVRPDEVIAK